MTIAQDHWLKAKKEKLVKSANESLDKLQTEYDNFLFNAVTELKKTIASDDRLRAIDLLYKISGSAGSMRWPLVSQISQWLRQVLEADEGVCLNPTTDLLMKAVETLVRENYKGEMPIGQILVHETYQMLIKLGYKLS